MDEGKAVYDQALLDRAAKKKTDAARSAVEQGVPCTQSLRGGTTGWTRREATHVYSGWLVGGQSVSQSVAIG